MQKLDKGKRDHRPDETLAEFDENWSQRKGGSANRPRKKKMNTNDVVAERAREECVKRRS